MQQGNAYTYFKRLPPLPLLRVFALERCLEVETVLLPEHHRFDEDAAFFVSAAQRELLERCRTFGINEDLLSSLDRDVLEQVEQFLRGWYPAAERAMVELDKMARLRNIPPRRWEAAQRLRGWLDALELYGMPFVRKVDSLPDPVTWRSQEWAAYFRLFPQDEYRLVILGAVRNCMEQNLTWFCDRALQYFSKTALACADVSNAFDLPKPFPDDD